MQRKLLCCLGGIALGVGCVVPVARANEPVVGLDVGAAIPTEKFRNTADIGGVIRPWVGYRFSLGSSVAISLLGEPQFILLPTAVDQHRESDVTSVFSFTAGPRLSLIDENVEIYAGGGGGYYTDLSGPLDDQDAGFDFYGGLNYECARGTALGLFIRRDQSTMNAERHGSHDLTFLTTGLSLQHRFLPPPAVVAEAPPPPPPPPPPAPPVKKKIVLRGVNFDFDKSNLRADAKPILDEAIATLKEAGQIKIAVEGHTDSRGSDAYNEKLSVRRANTVEEYLAKGGIDSSRMTVAGFGESKPVASNDTDDGRAQNRRVELRVTQGD